MGRSLHSLVLQQAANRPDAPAVLGEVDQWSYAELAAAADRVARRIVAAGVAPGSLVGVLAPRTFETIAGLLGVLQSGCAYVPLDPSYPAERSRFVLEDARVAAVCAVDTSAALSLAGAAPVVSLAATADGRTVEGMARDVAPHDLAYVIYTSGTTGLPKGVAIEHAAAANTIDDLIARFGIGPNDRVLALSSFGFDLSVWDVFGMLAAGGAIVLPTDADHRDPEAWTRLLGSCRPTIWNTVPALMELMVAHAEANDPTALDALRMVWMSGDWIPVSLPNRIRTLNPAIKVVSMGGATEASIWSIVYPIDRVDPTWRSIPYGKALGGQTMEVLRPDLASCEVGEVGEIHIGGAGLAREYFRRPELTAEKFIRDPRSGDPRSIDPTARLYRTGDLGRLLSCGNIEFLGRADTQVKINGNRIELAEIDSALVRHPAVREAATTAPRDPGGRLHLVAHVVPRGSEAWSPDVERSLLEHMAATLPDYMVPHRVTTHEALPLSANGKVDRARLPAPEWGHTSTKATTARFANEVERRLAGVWRAALKIDDVAPDDNFFRLGGDSLAAMTAVVMANKEFHAPFKPADFAESASLAEMARTIESRMADGVRASPWLVVRESERRPPLIYVPCLFGTLFPIQALAAKLPEDIPVRCLLPRGVDDPRLEPDGTIDAMAQRVADETAAAIPDGPLRLVGFSLGGTVAFEAARRLRAAGRVVDFLTLIDAPARPRPRWINRWLDRVSAGGPAKPEELVPDRAGDRSTPYSRRVHLAACETYRPRPYDGAALVVRVSRSRSLAAGLIDAIFGRWDWSDLTPGATKTYWLPCDHEGIFRGESLELLAKRMAEDWPRG